MGTLDFRKSEESLYSWHEMIFMGWCCVKNRVSEHHIEFNLIYMQSSKYIDIFPRKDIYQNLNCAYLWVVEFQVILVTFIEGLLCVRHSF